MKASVLVLICALLSLPACSQPRESDPQEEIVRQLSKRRIVMLGDFAHEFPLSNYGLITTLNTWLTMLDKGESDQRRLTLFLEDDGQVTELLRQYLKTGDLSPWLDFVLPGTSIERLEFYADLRAIALRIESMNSTLAASKKIMFDVQGPEAMNIFDPRILDLSARSSRLFFVRERDSLIANNVVTYLNGRADYKALIFYGNGHLIKNDVQKDMSGILTPDESKGKFLGYYLKTAFGDSAVFTINQIGRTRSQLKLDSFAGKDAYLLSSQVPWKDSHPDDNDIIPENFDAFIIRDGFIVQAHPLRYVFSKKVVEAAIRGLQFSEPHRSGAMGNRLFQQAMITLAFLADTNYSTTNQWTSWSASHQFEGSKRLQSGELRRVIAARSTRVLGTREFGGIIDDLINMGFDSRVGSPTMTPEEWNTHLTEQWSQIAVLNAIGALWIGDPAEQAAARTYLIQASGENLTEPSQYLKWWRKRYFDVSY